MRINLFKLLGILSVLLFCSCVEAGATPYDSENKCWGEYQTVDTSISFGIGGGCEGSITYAEDEDGNLWEFLSTCVPDCFNNPDSLTESIRFAPRCSDD